MIDLSVTVTQLTIHSIATDMVTHYWEWVKWTRELDQVQHIPGESTMARVRLSEEAGRTDAYSSVLTKITGLDWYTALQEITDDGKTKISPYAVSSELMERYEMGVLPYPEPVYDI